MTTTESPGQVQPLLIAAYAGFASGVIILFAALLLTLPGHYFEAMLFLSASLFSFSTGEFFNHPRQRLITPETVKTRQKLYHRKRAPCALGNLFDIGALLLLFIALSSLFFPH